MPSFNPTREVNRGVGSIGVYPPPPPYVVVTLGQPGQAIFSKGNSVEFFYTDYAGKVGYWYRTWVEFDHSGPLQCIVTQHGSDFDDASVGPDTAPADTTWHHDSSATWSATLGRNATQANRGNDKWASTEFIDLDIGQPQVSYLDNVVLYYEEVAPPTSVIDPVTVGLNTQTPTLPYRVSARSNSDGPWHELHPVPPSPAPNTEVRVYDIGGTSWVPDPDRDSPLWEGEAAHAANGSYSIVVGEPLRNAKHAAFIRFAQIIRFTANDDVQHWSVWRRTDFTIAAPVGTWTLTGPASPSIDNRPTVEWTYTPGMTGQVQSKWELWWYTKAQTLAPGFTPGVTGAAYKANGTSTLNNRPPDGLANNDYVVYLRGTSRLNGIDYLGPFRTRAITIAAPAPTVTVTDPVEGVTITTPSTTIRWTYGDGGSGQNQDAAYVLLVPASTYTKPGWTPSRVDPAVVTVTGTAALLNVTINQTGDYRAYVQTAYESGGITYYSTWDHNTFKVYLRPPQYRDPPVVEPDPGFGRDDQPPTDDTLLGVTGAFGYDVEGHGTWRGALDDDGRFTFRVLGGDITFDARRDVRGEAVFEVLAPTGEVVAASTPTVVPALSHLNIVDTDVSFHIGITNQGFRQVFDLGLFHVDKITHSPGPAGDRWEVVALDHSMMAAASDPFLPESFQGWDGTQYVGDFVDLVIVRLLELAGLDVNANVAETMSRVPLDVVLDPTRSVDILTTIVRVAAGVGWSVWARTDLDAHLDSPSIVVGPSYDANAVPLFAFVEGATAVMVTPDVHEWERQRLADVAVATSPDQAFGAYAWWADPLHPLYRDGFDPRHPKTGAHFAAGAAPVFVSDALIQSQEAARDAARRALLDSTAAVEPLEFTCPPLPWLRPGQVITVAQRGVVSRATVEAVTIPLTVGQTMRVRALASLPVDDTGIVVVDRSAYV